MGKHFQHWAVFFDDEDPTPTAYFAVSILAEQMVKRLKEADHTKAYAVRFSATEAMWRALFKNGWLVREEQIRKRKEQEKIPEPANS